MDAKCRFFWSSNCKGLPLASELEEGRRLAQEIPERTVVQEQYPTYSMYSVWDGQGRFNLVTVGGEGESVYQLDEESL